jgi:hypothetical protein
MDIRNATRGTAREVIGNQTPVPILNFPQEGIMDDRKDVNPGRRTIASVILLMAAMVFVLSCSVFGAGTPAEPSNTPKPADTEAPAASNTPMPTNTSEPTKTEKATPNKAATNRAKDEKTQQAQTEFAGAVLGEVESKLDEVGEIMGAGSVIWLDPSSIEMESSKPNMIWYTMLDDRYDYAIEAGNFALHTVVKWETKGNAGIVNCVIMFRVGDDLDMDPWYSLRLSRISGASATRFDLWQNWSLLGPGKWNGSSYIRDGNGDENEVILVANANQMTAYVNGKQTSVWWNSKVDYGRFGYGTLQDYGTTTCTYSDNWIWEWA